MIQYLFKRRKRNQFSERKKKVLIEFTLRKGKKNIEESND